jgi:hypothetical protein
MKLRLPPPKCLAVDVDGTLITSQGVNPTLVEEIRERHADGFDVVVWSMRGRAYAERAAEAAGISDLVVCISKPGYIVDDVGLDWLRDVVVVGRVDRLRRPFGRSTRRARAWS